MSIKFKPFYWRDYFAKAEVVSELPEVEKLDFAAGRNQIVRCEKLDFAVQNSQSDDGCYEFFEVEEFWGSQCNDPEDYEQNSTVYYIALFHEFDDDD